MYVIAVKDDTQVLGFRLFAGYATNTQSFNVDLCGVQVKSFIDEQKYVVGMIYQTLEFALNEAFRHTKLIEEQLGVHYDMYPMSLQQLERRMRNWK
jgi:hypothetical protein